MGCITVDEARRAEARALAAGLSEEDLLDTAGRHLGWAVGRFFPKAGTVIAYLGKGHNAGDALVALKVLRDRFGWEILLRWAHGEGELAPLVRKNSGSWGMPSP